LTHRIQIFGRKKPALGVIEQLGNAAHPLALESETGWIEAEAKNRTTLSDREGISGGEHQLPDWFAVDPDGTSGSGKDQERQGQGLNFQVMVPRMPTWT
jgi:hypothetical protein